MQQQQQQQQQWCHKMQQDAETRLVVAHDQTEQLALDLLLDRSSTCMWTHSSI
jgi:hypothetical protein